MKARHRVTRRAYRPDLILQIDASAVPSAEQRDALFVAQVAHCGERIAQRRAENRPQRRWRHDARGLTRFGRLRRFHRCRGRRRRVLCGGRLSRSSGRLGVRLRLEQIGWIFLGAGGDLRCKVLRRCCGFFRGRGGISRERRSFFGGRGGFVRRRRQLRCLIDAIDFAFGRRSDRRRSLLDDKNVVAEGLRMNR